MNAKIILLLVLLCGWAAGASGMEYYFTQDLPVRVPRLIDGYVVSKTHTGYVNPALRSRISFRKYSFPAGKVCQDEFLNQKWLPVPLPDDRNVFERTEGGKYFCARVLNTGEHECIAVVMEFDGMTDDLRGKAVETLAGIPDAMGETFQVAWLNGVFFREDDFPTCTLQTVSEDELTIADEDNGVLYSIKRADPAAMQAFLKRLRSEDPDAEIHEAKSSGTMTVDNKEKNIETTIYELPDSASGDGRREVIYSIPPNDAYWIKCWPYPKFKNDAFDFLDTRVLVFPMMTIYQNHKWEDRDK